ncbi:MAG: hypothetical protein ACP6IY_09725 [Promethearchaeia archaeon]
MIEDNKVQEEQIKNKISLVKILSIIFLIFTTVILVFVKIKNPDFSIKYVVLIGIGILFIFLIAFLSDKFKNFFNKNKKSQEKKEVPIISISEAVKYAQTLTVNKKYTDYIIEPFIEEIYTIGNNLKSKIFLYGSRGTFEKDIKYYVIINLQNIKLFTILQNPKKEEIILAINNLAKEMNLPEEREITRVENILTGIKSETVKTKPSEKKEEKNKIGELKE